MPRLYTFQVEVQKQRLFFQPQSGIRACADFVWLLSILLVFFSRRSPLRFQEEDKQEVDKPAKDEQEGMETT